MSKFRSGQAVLHLPEDLRELELTMQEQAGTVCYQDHHCSYEDERSQVACHISDIERPDRAGLRSVRKLCCEHDRREMGTLHL